MMGYAAHQGLSGLQWLGETLDKPGRAVRGLLAGRPEALANLIPFSDTMGITDPQDATSGRDLLETYGILDKNTDGLDTGDFVGFLAEIALDPLTYASFGASAISKSGKFAKSMGLLNHAPLAASAKAVKAAKELGHVGDVAKVGKRAAIMNTTLRETIEHADTISKTGPNFWMGKAEKMAETALKKEGVLAKGASKQTVEAAVAKHLIFVSPRRP